MAGHSNSIVKLGMVQQKRRDRRLFAWPDIANHQQTGRTLRLTFGQSLQYKRKAFLVAQFSTESENHVVLWQSQLFTLLGHGGAVRHRTECVRVDDVGYDAGMQSGGAEGIGAAAL